MVQNNPQIGETWIHEGQTRVSVWIIEANDRIRRVDNEPDPERVQKNHTIWYGINNIKTSNRWRLAKEDLFSKLYEKLKY